MDALAVEASGGRGIFDTLLEEGCLCAVLYLTYAHGTKLLRKAQRVYQKAEDKVEAKVQALHEPGVSTFTACIGQPQLCLELEAMKPAFARLHEPESVLVQVV
jgi:hypothetical protein